MQVSETLTNEISFLLSNKVKKEIKKQAKAIFRVDAFGAFSFLPSNDNKTRIKSNCRQIESILFNSH